MAGLGAEWSVVWVEWGRDGDCRGHGRGMKLGEMCGVKAVEGWGEI